MNFLQRVKLSNHQLERLSEISGNVSVAWFSSGIIAPIFIKPQTLLDFLPNFGVSLVLTGIFVGISLYISGKEHI